ncbi:MAG: type VI secretion system baseplate subunit TssG [Isosphaeraceae bacterium]
MEDVEPEGRGPDAPLIERLRSEPYRFSFFRAVRLLELADPSRPPVGYFGEYGPRDEAVRFSTRLSLEFPSSEIHDCTLPEAGGDGGAGAGPRPQPRITVAFLGLIGRMGVLPFAYTEELLRAPIDRAGRKQLPAVLDFLDMFQHRLISLFYRAWEKYRIAPQWERALRQERAGSPRSGGESRGPAGLDVVSGRFLALMGLGPPSLRDRQGVADSHLLFFTNLYAMQHRSAAGLERLLCDYFGRPAEVRTFEGQWLHLRPDQRTRLGRTGAFATLGGPGGDAVAGRKAWDDPSKFRVRVGPIDFATFRAFLPGGRSSTPLFELTRLYVRGEFDFDLQLVLLADEVPDCRIGRATRSGAGVLGRSAWLKSRPFAEDRDDAVFRSPI